MRRGYGIRLRQIPALCALAASVGAVEPAFAQASDEAAARRVAIRTPERPDKLLNEALLRVQGELGAMGLEANVELSANANLEPTAPPSEAAAPNGVLVLERDGFLIRIRASGPAAAEPVVQELDTRRADVTAEVIAVRAVEALRAVMTGGLPLRRSEKTAAPRTPPKIEPSPPLAVPPTIESTGRASFAPADRGALALWAAPGVFFDHELRRAGVGAELDLTFGQSSVFGGVTGTTSLVKTTFHSSAGEIEVRRSSALARLGYALPLMEPIECWVSAGAGFTRYSIAGHAAAEHIGESHHHVTPLLALSAGASAWLSHYFALFGRAEATWATDAATLRVDYRDFITLERPTLWLSLGFAVRAPL